MSLRRCAQWATLVCGCSGGAHDGPATQYDTELLQARVSACLALNAAQSVTFFWPERLGGVTADGSVADCVRNAGPCTEVLACAGYADEPCLEDRCEENVAAHCRALANGSTVVVRTPCDGAADGNSTCSVEEVLKEGRLAFCHGGPCEHDHCRGSVQVTCRNGHSVQHDCAGEGRTCVADPAGTFCALETRCSQDRCDRDVLELCRGGHVELRARCQDVIPGTRCAGRDDRVECFAADPVAICAERRAFESWCDTGRAWTCFGGVPFEVDCSGLEGASCHDDAALERAGCIWQ